MLSSDSTVIQLQQLSSPAPDAMTFAETAASCSAW